MPRALPQPQKPTASPHESYVFEIKEWEPSHLLSVNQDRYREGAYSEYLTIEFAGLGIHPDAIKGRTVRFDISGRRDMLEPDAYRRDPRWRPLCVGALETHRSVGQFYFSVPHDDMAFLLFAFVHGQFRYISLWGPVMKRGKSLCSSVHFMRSVDLSEL
jgi:hypothetical protein